MTNYYDKQLQRVLPKENNLKGEIKIKVVNDDQSTNWMSLNLDSIDSLQAFIDILKEDLEKPKEKPKEKLFDVWIEGYRATGGAQGATFGGSFTGRTFRDAVIKWKSTLRLSDQKTVTIPKKGRPDMWGCRIYDNETQARKSFG